MKISSTILNKISYIYLSIPLFLFLASWLNPPMAICSITALCIILYCLFLKMKDGEIAIPKVPFLITIGICMLWVYCSGIGGMFFQNFDWHIRNALMKDLIDFPFPVQYDNHSALVYYLGTMLPAAVFGKFTHLLGASSDMSFRLANLFNYVYCSLGIILTALQLFTLLKARDRQFYVILPVLVFFSGLDCLLSPLYAFSLDTITSHIQWHNGVQYSSNTTLLFWVYNQTIAPWLITILLCKKPFAIQNYVLLGTLALFYAPFPFLGVFIYLTVLSIIKLIQNFRLHNLKLYLKRVFSLPNILCLIFIFPIVYFYYKSNTMVEETTINILHLRLTFFLYAAGIYLLLIFKKFKKNPIYYITFISLLIFPSLKFGNQGDLCMRISIPALFILMVMILQFLFDKKMDKHLKIILAITLSLGAITPIHEFARGIDGMINPPFSGYIQNRIVTLNNKIHKPCIMVDHHITPTNYCNYGTTDFEDTIFFKYFASKRNLK